MFFLILSIYTLIYNIAIYVAAKFYEVRVDQFYLWLDYGFRIFKMKIGETEFGLGWLPLGGYVKLSGYFLEEGEEVLPYHFENLPLSKQLVITLIGPLLNLILALIVFAFFYEVPLFEIAFLVAILIAIVAGFFVLVKVISPITKRVKEKNETFKLIVFVLLIALYINALATVADGVNEFFPLFDCFNNIYSGNLKSILFSEGQLTHSLKILISAIGIFLFFINLLPIVGFNGFKVVSILYRFFAGSKVPEKFVDYLSQISGIVIILIYALIIYFLVVTAFRG